MVPIVLSGGSGTRLWPVSRESYPKQFAEFFDRSFLRQTLERVKVFGHPRVVTLESMRALTERALVETGLPRTAVITEPYGKNTAPAVCLMAHLLNLEKMPGQTVVGVFPADHLIANESAFTKAARLAEQLAQARQVVTFGIRPTSASTGYGYLELDNEPRQNGAFNVRHFYEKPDPVRAEKFFQSSRFFWNSGIFFFRLDHLRELFAKYTPELSKKIGAIRSDLDHLKHLYANIESISIDHALLEKLTDSLVCLPADFGWSDVGSWDELARLQDEKAPIDSKAKVHSLNSLHNFVYSAQPKIIALCDVENVIIVDTSDALLVVRRGSSQKVKELVEQLREQELPVVDEHRFEIRPWGDFEILADDDAYKVKRLTIDASAQMSYQVHSKRDEHWVVVRGEAEIQLENETKILEIGDQFVARREQKHRIRNRGQTPLVIIEVQTGEYFGEDDIVRIEDDYNRA